MSFICFPDLSSVQDLPFYTVSVGLHYWQYPTERPDGYAYPQFLYSSQGQGILTTEGYTIEIPPRSIIYLPPNSPHSYHAITDIWDVRWFVPSGFEALKLLQQLGFQKAAVFPITALKNYTIKFIWLFKEIQKTVSFFQHPIHMNLYLNSIDNTNKFTQSLHCHTENASLRF